MTDTKPAATAKGLNYFTNEFKKIKEALAKAQAEITSCNESIARWVVRCARLSAHNLKLVGVLKKAQLSLQSSSIDGRNKTLLSIKAAFSSEDVAPYLRVCGLWTAYHKAEADVETAWGVAEEAVRENICTARLDEFLEAFAALHPAAVEPGK